MVNIISIIVVTLIVCGIGGAGMYFLWLKTRPKKITWNAKVYQLGEGVKPPVIDSKGKVLSDLQLKDLRPYTTDVVEKIEKEPGITVYRLLKLNKTVPAVTNDCVDYWGENRKEVNVLIDGETCTLLKKGYDSKAGVIFNPLPYSRINMIKGEMAIRKDRLRKEKDILQAITPWIVAGICMMGLVAIIYIGVNGFITMSENIAEAEKYSADKTVEAANIIRVGMGKDITNTGSVEDPIVEPPPLLES